MLLDARLCVIQFVLPGLCARLQVFPRRCFESNIQEPLPARHRCSQVASRCTARKGRRRHLTDLGPQLHRVETVCPTCPRGCSAQSWCAQAQTSIEKGKLATSQDVPGTSHPKISPQSRKARSCSAAKSANSGGTTQSKSFALIPRRRATATTQQNPLGFGGTAEMGSQEIWFENGIGMQAPSSSKNGSSSWIVISRGP